MLLWQALKARGLSPNLVYCRSNPGCVFATIFRLPVVCEVHAPFAAKSRFIDWLFDFCVVLSHFSKLL